MKTEIEFIKGGKRASMHERVADAIVDSGLARYATRHMKPVEVEISPRTGKPKRKYSRRDMKAENE
jgi:hypothetical protein